MIYYDTETCGFHGPIVLMQFAFDDGPVKLWCPWKERICDTIKMMEIMMRDVVCGFNLAFDHFHLCQMYTTLLLMEDKEAYLEDCIEEYALKEPEARSGPCLKPKGALDLMLHARKGPYQSTMDRSDIVIKRVPTALAWYVRDELDKRILLKDVYFARKKDKTKRWQVFDIRDDMDEIIPDFKNIVLKFAPSSALKALAIDTGVASEDRLLFSEVELSKNYRPAELGYAPFALAIGKPGVGTWNKAWPMMIRFHIDHWCYNKAARRYAEDDVLDVRGLYKFFGSPDPNDDDSILACMVGAVRWRGFKINIEAIQALKDKAQGCLDKVTIKYNSPKVCKAYMEEVLSDEEKLIMQGSTKGVILEEVSKWKEAVVCETCLGMDSRCPDCEDGLVEGDDRHPAAIRAQEILDARHYKKEMELYDKLLLAKRFHASFKVIGTLSGRMAGGDKLNAQGIKGSEEVRSAFPLADEDYDLGGGDFDAFEVGLADAEYGDPKMREYLMSGKKIHAIFGQFLFPGMSYDDIMATEKLAGEHNKYKRSKNGLFAMLYGGEEYTLQTRVGVSEQTAQEAYSKWCKEFRVWAKERKKIFDMFCSMRQPGGLGSKVQWADPRDYIESMFGFRRYFTLENMIVKALFDLAENPPPVWSKFKVKITRRDREQTAAGACRSAVFAAAFAVQASNMRAAGNHVIQSSGATITKRLQRKIWDIQPIGVHEWIVQPLNVHDEVMNPTHPDYVEEVRDVVNEFVESLVPKVPLIAMKWKTGLPNWAGK